MYTSPGFNLRLLSGRMYSEDSDRCSEVEIRSYDCERRTCNNCYRTLRRRKPNATTMTTTTIANGARLTLVLRRRDSTWTRKCDWSPTKLRWRIGFRGLQTIVIRISLRENVVSIFEAKNSIVLFVRLLVVGREGTGNLLKRLLTRKNFDMP